MVSLVLISILEQISANFVDTIDTNFVDTIDIYYSKSSRYVIPF